MSFSGDYNSRNLIGVTLTDRLGGEKESAAV